MPRQNKFETDPKTIKRKHLKRVLRCDICPPHAKENATKQPRSDKHKSRRKGRC